MQDSYESGEERSLCWETSRWPATSFRYDSRKRSKTNLIVFLRPVILRSKDSYSGITNARYDYVIGQQRGIVGDDTLLRASAPARTAADRFARTRGAAHPDLTPPGKDRASAPTPAEERTSVLP